MRQGFPDFELVYSVSEINRFIADLFASSAELSSVMIRGEISNFTNHAASGHYYFSLKDAGSRISCVMFKNHNRSLKFVPQNGMSVVARGYVATYQQRGEYQLYAQSMEREGTGELYKRYLELKDRLEKAGYFDERRKRPLPVLPRRIGIVTAPEGAVICDILNILARRFPNMPVLLAPAYVQGAMAADSICDGIRRLNAIEDVDVIIVARGGGSLEELWPFNEEKVAMAVAGSKKPVISAVGHQTDFTVCDFVSDLRAPTPSAAAELVVFAREEKLSYLGDIAGRLESAMGGRLESAAGAVTYLGQKLALHSPEKVFENLRMHLDGVEMAMRANLAGKLATLRSRFSAASPRQHLSLIRSRLAMRREKLAAIGRAMPQAASGRLSSAAAALENLWLRFGIHDHRNVLRLGYSLVSSKKSGRLVRSASQVSRGEPLSVMFHDGEVAVTAD